MKTLWRSLRIGLEVVGVLALVWGGGTLFLMHTFKDFAGGSCEDTEQRILTSPENKHSTKSFHRVSGDEHYAFEFFYLSTGNPNPSYEYTPLVTVENVGAGQTSVSWDGSDQVTVRYPTSAKIGDAYARVLDVRVVLDPPLPSSVSSR